MGEGGNKERGKGKTEPRIKASLLLLQLPPFLPLSHSPILPFSYSPFRLFPSALQPL